MEELLFLSPDWIQKVTGAIQGARAKDENFRKLASGYSLNLAYVLTQLPAEIKAQYHSQDQLVVFVQLHRGMVRKLWIGTSLPKEKIDFTVSSSYKIAKQIFLGELNPATAFINGQFKVEPLSKVYLRPRFSAKSVVTGNFMLKIARQVPTRFVPDNGDKGGDAY